MKTFKSFTRPTNLVLMEPANHNCSQYNYECRALGNCSSCRKMFPSCELWILDEWHASEPVRFAYCEDCIPAFPDTKGIKNRSNAI